MCSIKQRILLLLRADHGDRRVRARKEPNFTALIIAAVGCLAILGLSGCTGGMKTAEARDDIPPRRGGTVWMESAQEPSVLNSYLGVGGMSITDVVTTPMKSQWVSINDEGEWIPFIATSVPTLENGGVTVTSTDEMIIKFQIDPDAVWSDNTPITCADMEFTWRTMINPKWAVGSRLGWELISSIDCSNQKRVVINLREPYAPYLPTLLNTSPLPAHELRGKDFNTIWNNRITLSSGPFVFTSWRRGDRLILERNPHWWRAGSEGRPYLDRIVTRFVPDASTMKLDLRMEDADIIGLPADTNLPQELSNIPNTTYDVRPGAGWENLTYNTARFPLNDARVRRAISYAVDRDAIVDVVLRGQVPRLDSTLLPYQKPFSHPIFDRYKHDPARTADIMKKSGWTLNDNGVWRSRSGKLAKLMLTTMTGNPLRLKAIQLVAAQLEDAGFATEIVMAKPEVFFASIVSHGEYDIAMYSFTQGLDPSQSKVFACSEIARAPNWAGKNNFKYCSREVDRLLRASDRELNVERRAALMHQIAERLATDLPTLPLYQQPDTLAWNRRLRGVLPNAMGRHLWNIDDWWVVDP